VRQILAAETRVAEKRMVGGLSFLMNGHLCCGVAGPALMVRVGPEAHKRALARPHVRPVRFAGRTLAAFVLVEPEGFRTRDALASWVRQGLDFVSALPVKKRVKKRPRPKSTPR
jgi:TfoX/Sxy family transcriptional regulator of competence genes